MAASGLLLFGFLLSHVAGNALLMMNDGGRSYDDYAADLRSLGPLLWVARTGLASLFLIHISLALVVSAQNRRARGGGRRPTGSEGGPLAPSRSMLLTGLLVTAFLIAHLWHFSFDRRFASEGASLVKRVLSEGPTLTLYTFGVLALWVHLWHALPSALQSLGWTHQRWNPPLRAATRVAVSAVSALFLAILFSVFLGR